MWVILVPKRYKFWNQAKGGEDGEIGFPPFSLLFLLKRRFPFITRILPLASAYVRGLGTGVQELIEVVVFFYVFLHFPIKNRRGTEHFFVQKVAKFLNCSLLLLLLMLLLSFSLLQLLLLLLLLSMY